MSDTMQRDAAMAQALIDNPLLMDILAELDTNAVKTWRSGANPMQREAAWHEMMAVQSLVHRIRGRIETKLIAEKSAERKARANG
jgi:hypothetical protein